MENPCFSILVVDDEEDLAALYGKIIKTLGHEVQVFTNPLSALDHFSQYPDQYALVLTDLRMPGMCGMELAHRIKDINPSIKIFLLTAFDIADVETSWAVHQAKFDKIIQKPLRLSLLRESIEAIRVDNR